MVPDPDKPDEDNSKLWGRYAPMLLPRSLGGSLVARLASLGDLAVFVLQDVPMLKTQLDPPGDISQDRLYEADRAIGLLSGARRRLLRKADDRREGLAARAAG